MGSVNEIEMMDADLLAAQKAATAYADAFFALRARGVGRFIHPDNGILVDLRQPYALNRRKMERGLWKFSSAAEIAPDTELLVGTWFGWSMLMMLSRLHW